MSCQGRRKGFPALGWSDLRRPGFATHEQRSIAASCQQHVLPARRLSWPCERARSRRCISVRSTNALLVTGIFSRSEPSLPRPHVSASSDCSSRQYYTSQLAQLRVADKFGRGRMAGWPWPPARVKMNDGLGRAVPGLAESREPKPATDAASFTAAGNWDTASV